MFDQFAIELSSRGNNRFNGRRHRHTMDDNLSIKSSDSVTTSGEYEIVPEELELSAQSGTSPTLKIANNGNINDLEKNLHEMIRELDRSTSPARRFKMEETGTVFCLTHILYFIINIDLCVLVVRVVSCVSQHLFMH